MIHDYRVLSLDPSGYCPDSHFRLTAFRSPWNAPSLLWRILAAVLER